METSTGPALETGLHVEGLEVDGKYRLGASLGERDRQAVYETFRGETPAVIKLFRPETAEEASDLLAGFAAGKRFQHPNLLQVYDFGEVVVYRTPCVYVVTERPDENLAGVLRGRALDAAETRQILQGVIPALEALHAGGYVHGRVQPSEVLACGETVKLSADGIRPISSSRLDADVGGLYSAPETGLGSFVPFSDSWSLAALTLETLTRSPLRSGIDRLSSPFREIVEGGMAVDPEFRWSVSQIRQSLEGGVQTSADPQNVVPISLTPKYLRFGGLAIGGALAAASICVLLVRSAHQGPAPVPVTVQAPAVAKPPAGKVPENKPLASVPVGWAVVGASYRSREDAEKRAAEIHKAHAKLNPRVYVAAADGSRYVVILSSGLSEAQAKRKLNRARSGGAPKDSYTIRFR